MEKELDFYKRQRKKILALNYAAFLAGWDMQTEAAEGSIAADAEQHAVIAEMTYMLQTDEKFVQCVENLFRLKDKLDDVSAHEIIELRKNIENTRKIPMEEFTAFRELTSKAYPVYVQAKNSDDFSLFAPYLEKIIAYCKKLTEWLATDELKGYDVLLDMYEPRYTKSTYDKFFDVLKRKLVPFVKKVTSKQTPLPDFALKIYPEEGQKKFCEYLRGVMCFDKSRGVMKESEHPFTSGFGTDDVRITVHYYPDNFVSSIFSVIHETGHALYEQQCDVSLNGTFCSGGASLGMHESQSRFYENIIGRSKAFWNVHFPKLAEIFPEQLKGVTVGEFVSYVNRAEMTFIRTEADELTYPLHVMLRYDMEKAFIEGDLEVKDFPSYWNKLFTEYFGITPPDDRRGVLQDVHWAYGDIGYFPTYALGSAISAQLYHAMKKDFDVEKSLESGDCARINAWLKEHVHKYGSGKYPDEILRLATGEDFNPDYYVDYLMEKYSAL